MATKLSEFRITVGTGGNSTNALYANGNQQCKVIIEILKVSFIDGAWKKTNLTPAEVNSLTVMTYSDQLFPSPPLPNGWFCATQPNEYTEGLRGSTYSSPAPALANDAAQIFERYMRADRPGPQRFMACVTLDGNTRYSTHFNSGDERYESSITIDPVPAYALKVSQLKADSYDIYHCGDKDNEINVKAYNWALPGGLTIRHESFSNAGYTSGKLMWAYCLKDKFVRMGVAVRKGVNTLTLGDIDGGLPSKYWNVQVNPLPGDNLLRAEWYESWSSVNKGNYSNSLKWTITDNYGCVSQFVLRASNNNGSQLNLFDV